MFSSRMNLTKHPFLLQHFLRRRAVHTSMQHLCPYELKDNLQDCYFVLRVTEDCDDHELRQAYIDLAKQYHPDSGTKTADSKKFTQVETAYKTVLVGLFKIENYINLIEFIPLSNDFLLSNLL